MYWNNGVNLHKTKNMMIQESISRLEYLCKIIPSLLNDISVADFLFKPSPEKWSKQQVLGHLIDSATNNHQRFIRVQFEDVPYIRYDQNQWNHYSFYHDLNTAELIEFWRRYNLHLVEIIKRIEPSNLSRFCHTGGENPVTLEFLVNDYVQHLEHHLKELVNYP